MPSIVIPLFDRVLLVAGRFVWLMRVILASSSFLLMRLMDELVEQPILIEPQQLPQEILALTGVVADDFMVMAILPKILFAITLFYFARLAEHIFVLDLGENVSR